MVRETLLALLATLSSLYNQSVEFIWPTVAGYIEIVEHAPQIMCGVCDEVIADNAQNIIVTSCHGESHIAHVACMNSHLQQQDNLDCPTCYYALTADDLEHVLIVLNDGDVIIPEDDTPEGPVIEYHECTICLDDCDQQWPHVVTLHCQAGEHQFHVDCLHEAIYQHDHTACPNCRSIISQEDRDMIDVARQFVLTAEPSAPPLG